MLKRSSACAQHPDLVEKRRKVFAERIVRYLRSQQKQDGGDEGMQQQNGTEGPARRRPPVARATV